MRVVQENPGAAPIKINEAAWWVTLFTSMFMHGGILHIAGNMLFLWVFGNNIEDRLGRLKFVLFYLLSGLGGLICYTLFFRDSNYLLLGASGAIFGVMGAYALQWPKQEMYLFWVVPMRVLTLVMLGHGVGSDHAAVGLLQRQLDRGERLDGLEDELASVLY